jgi:hypothetical protein
MKKKPGTFFGFTVILLAAIFTIACKNPAGGDGGGNSTDGDGGGGANDPPQRSFSVSGKFTKSGDAGSGEVKFNLKSDTASAGRAVTAGSYTISGLLEDGAFLIRLKGSYDPNKGTWSVSARSSTIIYTLDGSVDSAGNSRGSTATIVVAGVPYVFPIAEQGVTISEGDVNTEYEDEGVPAFAQGWWQAAGPGENVSFLVSPWKIKYTKTKTDGPHGMDVKEVEYTLLEITGSGAGPYTAIYTWPEYKKTSANLAKAAGKYLFGKEDSVTALTDEQAKPGAHYIPQEGEKYVYYDETSGSTRWGGFTRDQLEKFFAEDYWKKWLLNDADPDSITPMYGASRVSFNSATAPTSFSLVDLVKVDNPQQGWEYTHDFESLAALEAAVTNLVEKHKWKEKDGSWEDRGPDVQTLTR